MLAIGLDGYPEGWVVAAVNEGGIADVAIAADLEAALRQFPGASSVGIDMPIGLPEGSAVRPAELEARKLLTGAKASSVFMTPPLAVISASTHAEAIAAARELGCAAPSAQAYALRRKILEVAPVAARDPRLFEVHPEVAFHVLNGGRPLAARKRSWAGMHERLAILAGVGLHVPRTFEGAGRTPPDDVLDAAVTGWVAWQHARGEARFLPGEVPVHPHHRIWYAPAP